MFGFVCLCVFTLGKTVEIKQMLLCTTGRNKTDHSRNYAY